MTKQHPGIEAADQLLKQIGADQEAVSALSSAMTQRIEAIKSEMQPMIDQAKEALAAHERALSALANQIRKHLIDDADQRIDLAFGSLVFATEFRVRRIRRMLENLESAGRIDLIRTTKAVDWDGVEKLSNPELAALGTRRDKKELFSYELAG